MYYPDLENLPEHLKAILTEKRGANVFKMLMHSPNMAPSITAVVDALMASPHLPAQWRELAIVRVGHHYQAPYEIHQHNQIGRMTGLNDAQLAACTPGADQSCLSGDEREILRLTDALIHNHKLTPNERSDALNILNVNGLTDFVLTVGYYQLVCNFLNSYEVEIEEKALFG